MKRYDTCPTCGGKKRSEAKLCAACRLANPSPIIAAKSREISAARRVRFESLTWDSFTRDTSGRYRAHYWPDEAAKRVKLYRYQWVWITSNGPIPVGFDIHHANEIKDDDRLENLELKAHADHTAHHMRRSHPYQKLTAEQRAEILASPENGAALARRLGVQRSTVNRYRKRHGRYWRYESEAIAAASS